MRTVSSCCSCPAKSSWRSFLTVRSPIATAPSNPESGKPRTVNRSQPRVRPKKSSATPVAKSSWLASTPQAVDIISGPLGLDLKRCLHHLKNGGLMFLSCRGTIHDQQPVPTKPSAPTVSLVVTGNGLNIAQSVAVGLMTTLSVSFTAMVKRCAVS